MKKVFAVCLLLLLFLQCLPAFAGAAAQTGRKDYELISPESYEGYWEEKKEGRLLMAVAPTEEPGWYDVTVALREKRPKIDVYMMRAHYQEDGSMYYENCLFCTDDIHPNDLIANGDIDNIVRRAIHAGVDPIIAVKCASLHAARYFGLNDRGAVAPGYLADLVIIDNFENFNIFTVFKNGELMADRGMVFDIREPEIDPELVAHALDTFHLDLILEEDLIENRPRAVLGIIPGEIITSDEGYAEGIDVEKDILKIVVAERHNNTHHIGIGYIRGYGLKRGAVATSISHDSHNIIAVGTNEKEIAEAINRVVDLDGGIVVWDEGKVKAELQLQVAGLMSQEPLSMVNKKLEAAKAAAFDLGVSKGIDPFMTLSFMALPVIPTLRLTTRGVFDVTNQRYV